MPKNNTATELLPDQETKLLPSKEGKEKNPEEIDEIKGDIKKEISEVLGDTEPRLKPIGGGPIENPFTPDGAIPYNEEDLKDIQYTDEDVEASKKEGLPKNLRPMKEDKPVKKEDTA